MTEAELQQAERLHTKLKKTRDQLRSLRWLREQAIGSLQVEVRRAPDFPPPCVTIMDAEGVGLAHAAEETLLNQIQHLEAQLRNLGVEADQSEVKPLTP